MSLAGILSTVADDPRLSRALDIGRAESRAAGAGGDAPPVLPGVDLVAPSSLRPVLTAAVAAQLGQFVLAVTATAREAEDLTAALRAFLPPPSVATFPGWETLPHERLSPRSDTVGQRIAVLRRLAHPEPETPPTHKGSPAGKADQEPQPLDTDSAPQAPSRAPPGEGARGRDSP